MSLKNIGLFILLLIGSNLYGADIECNEKNIKKCMDSGLAALRDDNLEKAKGYFKTACDFKQSEGCFRLGYVEWENGNKGQALSLLQKSCKAKFKKACEMEKEVTREREKNKKLYLKLCGQSTWSACYDLGIDEGSYGNIDEAKKLFKKACDNNYQQACNVLKTM